MVQFGKTLNDVVKSDWRCHAVAYMELKRALSDSHGKSDDNIITATSNNCAKSKCGINGVNGCIDPNTPVDNSNDDDVHSVHTESSYCISDNQKAAYFRIYEDSILRLTQFYWERVQWAKKEKETLEKAMGRQLMEDEEANNEEFPRISGKKVDSDQSSSSVSFLIHQITNFSRDLGLALEFLELNVTAFSKIMKKFDKRTGSNLREIKLKELKERHPYLYDGGELKKCKNICSQWMKQLQSIISQQDSSGVMGQSKGHFLSTAPSSREPAGRVSLSLANSLKVAKSACADQGMNPQESGETMQKDFDSEKKLGNSASVSFEEVNKKTLGQRAPRSIHKTKDAKILERLIDHVNEELCSQKADSPFFDSAQKLEQNSPPSFLSSEVELAGKLGQGEFCKIYEVKKFNVLESCHICFLHRGYNDPDPSGKSPKKAICQKVPSTVNLNVSREDEGQHPASVDNEQPLREGTQAIDPHPTLPKQISAFSFDYDANILDYDELESDHEDEGYEQITRGFMKDHCLRNGEARYAIKRIRSCLEDHETITDAAIDLAREAEFLAALKHPNIIRIRGTINIPGHPKYALILDRLYDTLEVQMKKWKVDKKRYQGKFKGLIGKNKMMMDKLWMDRLVTAYDLARAMAYLHSHGILHRDIKPANVGFDIRGDIKIFDFGLAKELKPSEREGQDQYHTSGIAGTLRYMAPEMAQVRPYGLSSDVYSFAILMWEMLTLKAAYESYTREKHYKEIVVEGKRPKVPKSCPFVIKDLLERSWHKQPSERPTFGAVCELIRFGMPDYLEDSGRTAKSYKSLRGGYDDETDHHDEILESDTPSDSLSQSIRIKSPHLDLHKHHSQNAIPAIGVVEE